MHGFGRMRRAIVLVVLSVTLTYPTEVVALRVYAREAGVLDLSGNEWLYTKSADRPVPVASITKVVTALTFLRLTDDLDQLITITSKDWKGSGKTRLRVGDRVPARTLLKLALVASDNCAARALTHPFALTWEAYGYRMQETAWGLGCRRASFIEPTGLDPGNVATVREVALLFRAAVRDPVLKKIMGTNRFTLPTRRGPRAIVHSSRLLRYRRDVIAAKTGYLAAAGYCLVQYVEDARGGFITVVLGAPTKRARTRESARLIDYARRKRSRT